jgi:hypothetical protein
MNEKIKHFVILYCIAASAECYQFRKNHLVDCKTHFENFSKTTSDSLLPDLPGLEGPLIGFIQKFITAFDTNRESLMYCYASDAVFTLCVGRGTDMSEYRKHQRNLINYRFHMDGPNAEKYRSCRKFLIFRNCLLYDGGIIIILF